MIQTMLYVAIVLTAYILVVDVVGLTDPAWTFGLGTVVGMVAHELTRDP